MAANHFPLRLRNAAEDVPRLLLGAGRACGGEFVVAIDGVHGRVVLTHKKGRALTGFFNDKGDVPKGPTSEITGADAEQLLKALKAGANTAMENITLRGQWKGTLICETGDPIIHLERKIANYGTLSVSSDPAAGNWRWNFVRTETWFGGAKDKRGVAGSLALAIREGLRVALDLVSEACSVRDTTRRAARDPGFAATHPNRPAKEGKDPTEAAAARIARGKGGKAAATTAPAKPAETSKRSKASDTPAAPSGRKKLTQEEKDAKLLAAFTEAALKIKGAAA